MAWCSSGTSLVRGVLLTLSVLLASVKRRGSWAPEGSATRLACLSGFDPPGSCSLDVLCCPPCEARTAPSTVCAPRGPVLASCKPNTAVKGRWRCMAQGRCHLANWDGRPGFCNPAYNQGRVRRPGLASQQARCLGLRRPGAAPEPREALFDEHPPEYVSRVSGEDQRKSRAKDSTAPPASCFPIPKG